MGGGSSPASAAYFRTAAHCFITHCSPAGVKSSIMAMSANPQARNLMAGLILPSPRHRSSAIAPDSPRK